MKMTCHRWFIKLATILLATLVTFDLESAGGRLSNTPLHGLPYMVVPMTF